MNSVRRRALMSAGLMLSVAALTYAAKPTIYLADQIGKPDLEALIPKQFGAWRLDTGIPIVLPAPDVQAQLDLIYNQVLTRSYIDAKGQRVMLVIAYGGDQYEGTGAHRPEVCYPAQGFEITSNQKAIQRIASGDLSVRRLMSRRDERSEPVTYWIVVGNAVATSGLAQKVAQLRYGLRGVIADGLLVRVSSIDRSMENGHAIQADFIAELARAMPAESRKRLFGELAI